MTPEERARALVAEWEADCDGERPNVLGGDMADPDTDRMAADIARTIRTAVTEENERRPWPS